MDGLRFSRRDGDSKDEGMRPEAAVVLSRATLGIVLAMLALLSAG